MMHPGPPLDWQVSNWEAQVVESDQLPSDCMQGDIPSKSVADFKQPNNSQYFPSQQIGSKVIEHNAVGPVLPLPDVPGNFGAGALTVGLISVGVLTVGLGSIGGMLFVGASSLVGAFFSKVGVSVPGVFSFSAAKSWVRTIHALPSHALATAKQNSVPSMSVLQVFMSASFGTTAIRKDALANQVRSTQNCSLRNQSRPLHNARSVNLSRRTPTAWQVNVGFGS